MNFADYLALDALNATKLKWLLQSPLEYQYRLTHPKETQALVMGRAVHSAVLEPHLFESEYVVFPGKTRRGKAWDEYQEEHADHSILTKTEHEEAAAMAQAVADSPAAQVYLDQDAEREKTIEWIDELTGRKCKARLDLQCSALVDLKTTSSLDPRKFDADAYRFGYPLQLAWYHDGLNAATGLDLPVKLITVHKNAPHDVVVYDVPTNVIEHGRAQYNAALDLLESCEAFGHWPGVSTGEETLYLPEWAQHGGAAQ